MGLMPIKGQAPAESAPADSGRDPSRYVDDGEPNVSPEEQKQYDEAVKNGLRLIYADGQVRPQILDALKAGASAAPAAAPMAAPADAGPPPEGGPAADASQQPPEQAMTPPPEGGQPEGGQPSPPVFSLANTAVQLVMKLDDSARAANQPLDNDVLLHVGVAMISELAEVADAGKIHTYSEDEKSGALTVAMDMYRDKAIKDGRTTKEQLTSEFDSAVQADKAGNLDHVIPGAPKGSPQEPPTDPAAQQ